MDAERQQFWRRLVEDSQEIDALLNRDDNVGIESGSVAELRCKPCISQQFGEPDEGAISNSNVIWPSRSLASSRSCPLPLDCALALVRLYGEKHDRRYEPAALRYLEPLIVEERPSLTDVAVIASLLAEGEPR